MTTATDRTEPHDNHTYSMVMFDRRTLDFMLRSIDLYLSLIHAEDDLVAADPDLSALVSDDTRRELGLGKDKESAERVREWISDKINKEPDRQHIYISLSHWMARFLKSVGALYLSKLRSRRDILACKPNVTTNALASIDREILAKEEIFQAGGIFKNASLIPLLVEYQETDTKPTLAESQDYLSMAVRPRPVTVSAIEIIDAELRTRCLDLFANFQESGQSERNDTVISEASRILENRLRDLLKSDSGMNAKQLSTLAFNPDKPRLVISKVRAEQDAAHLLFLGAFGFIRNQVQHKLMADLAPERVMQVLGMFDYLISVMNNAEISDIAA